MMINTFGVNINLKIKSFDSVFVKYLYTVGFYIVISFRLCNC